jgi:recombination protein RecA
MPKEKKSKLLSPGQAVAYIDKQLGVSSFVLPPKYWLSTGSPYLNKVMGSEELGLAYGKLYTIAGPPSSGKSVLAAWLQGLAQKDGADCAWVDGENSFDRRHVRHQGLDPGSRIFGPDNKTVIGYEKIALFRTLYGEFETKLESKKGKKLRAIIQERSETAEELFTRVEVWMKLRRRQNPKGRLCVVVDSTTSFSPEEEYIAGLIDQNMRTRSSPAVFLNLMTKRWVDLALHTNAMGFFIAQLRTNPGKIFGDPRYIPGGNGILYYPSSTVWMNRVKGGEIIQGEDQVGIKGIITNRKNKVGGGSVEHKKCGYKCYFNKDAWKFMNIKEVKGETE